MRFGANYTPRRNWFHHWLDFDVQEQREDFEVLAGLGLDHVRVFCIWPVFQPNRGLVNRRALTDLTTLVDAAGEAGLDVTVDVVQGHLSGFDFYPSWTDTHRFRNIFADAGAVQAQAELVGTVAGHLRDHPAYLGVSLGNEPNNLLFRDPATAEQVDTWNRTLMEAAHEADPDHEHHASAYDAVWYDEGHPFTPQQLTTVGARTVIHPWVFSGGIGARYGGLSLQATRTAAYVAELARAWSPDPRRGVWVQEVGAPEGSVSAEQAPDFAERTVRALAAGPDDIWGVTWWCSHDVSRALLDFPELEYTLGLCDSDGEPKLLARRLQEVFAALADEPATPAPRGPALVLDVDDEPRRASAPGGRLFDAWMARAADGELAPIVTSERADDTAYLMARGITDTADIARGD
ncbi:cellulase (glycosyl hydrolase family 5) [Knoellia remsis]|uniref:Cellulase (Glycosyl hydrolase family 5) n=1 Tax=Knoellia remsis TaxID=407159 RepID=A0A2T0UY42_9MICO|nr:cellulase family glycosylhydrolase [Knoellia remsis]PRY62853.1 cellulase (glycosyl hydrolase family 5) [Knoellia remsis]